MQLPNGGFAPTTVSGTDDELDAPGEVIYALTQHYRRTGDRGFLREVWPTISKASRYIADKRRSNRSADPKTREILPASRSAEDIGSPNLQHYWDDFWCIRGLRDAAFVAGELGDAGEAVRIRAEARGLLDATWSSIRAVSSEHGISYIPNGPEELTSSAMARGTTAGLWPCEVLDPRDPFVRQSFDVYWDKWVRSSGGGFNHKGNFWPYAGLDLAQCYLMLGQPNRAHRILRWTIEHDPTGGFYSWPEGMDKKTLTLRVGDMPHGWFCAAYINLLRNMLFRESGDQILLFPNVPNDWLEPGKQISIADFPTLHGLISYRVRSSETAIELNIAANPGPPGGYRIILPSSIAAVAVDVDGRTEAFAQPKRELIIPSSARTVRIEIARR
ncbi:MAG: hypothetical protein A2Z18_03195 [Armatimonadetes bacterium RBG_16_58_9]|nr:MAG: hypothetical protein A2Z18_03195 [Armatimonadetes bacterium RBG_16_58_9]